MKFIDFFAGIGGFRMGMELAGHECVGFCEFDKFATASYISMHLLTEEQRKTLEDIPIKKRQKEILKDEYRNGEWYANDIRRVYAGDIPKADCWCFGFPCQDISDTGLPALRIVSRTFAVVSIRTRVQRLTVCGKPCRVSQARGLTCVHGRQRPCCLLRPWRGLPEVRR